MLSIVFNILDAIVRVATLIPIVLKALKEAGISLKTLFIVGCVGASFYYVDSYRVAQALFYAQVSHSIEQLSHTLTRQASVNEKFMEDTSAMLRQHDKDLIALKKTEELLGIPLYSDDRGRTYLQKERGNN